MKTKINVSAEMLAFVGDGAVPSTDWPEGSVALSFRLAAAIFAFHPDPATDVDLAAAELVLVVSTAACRRIFGLVPEAAAVWHLPSDMRLIALAIRDCSLAPAACETLRLAKSIELLCATFATIEGGSLVPADGSGALSQAEAQRIAAARRLIDEHWHETLTLESIARACGLNRARLTRGFRSMFDCSVADRIAELRLGGARQMLLATDLPVSSIGYRCGYLNSASFTRAFSRRFGVAPTQLRAAA